MSYIGKAIEKGLRKKNLSQKELARIVGVSPPNVNQWVKGTSAPSGDRLLRVIEILDIVSEFFPRYSEKKMDEDFDIKSLVKEIEEIKKRDFVPVTPEEKIIIIEDDDLMTILLKNALIAEGYGEYEVLHTPNALNALNIIGKENISLIILDLLMPGEIPGIEFLKMLRENPQIKNIPIIIHTGADSSEITKAKKYNPDIVLRKPFNYGKFSNAISSTGLKKKNVSYA